MKIKQRLILIAYFLLVPVFLWAGPMITGQGGGGGSMTYPGVGVAKSTGAAWDTSLAVGTDLQGWDTVLNDIAGLTATSNAVIGWNNGPTLGAYTTHSHDNSAAQFYDSTAPTKLFKIDPSTMAAGSTFTLQPAGGYTLRISLLGSMSVNLPATSITLPANPIGGTLGATNNVIPKSNGTGTATLQASNIVDDGTNVVVSTNFFSKLAGYVIAADSTITTTNGYGSIWYPSTSSVITLPTGAAGMMVGMRTIAATNPVFKPAGTGVISNAATNYTAGSGIRNTSATIGNYIYLHNPEGTTWYVHGAGGTWTQGDI